MIMPNESHTAGPWGPVLQVPAGWLVSEALGTFSHEKRKFMMLLLLAAKEMSGANHSGTWDAIDLYGESEDLYGGTHESATAQLEDEGYIQIEEDVITLTDKTRKLLGMEVG